MNQNQADKIYQLRTYQLWKNNAKKYSDKPRYWIIQMTADMAGIEYMDVVKVIREGKINDKN